MREQRAANRKRKGRQPLPRPPRAAFTLVELIIVVLIIGILAAFILTAASDGIRRAEERATQSLIMKLESAMIDRIEGLQTTAANPNNAHAALATMLVPTGSGTIPVGDAQRAQVIARIDQYKYELPDVFYFAPNAQNFDPQYPVNFAAMPYPGTSISGFQSDPYVLPLGNSIVNNGTNSFGAGLGGPGVGVYGASYTAAAGIYKQLGYQPQGYDGRDNNGDGRVDEMNEGDPGGTGIALTNLNLHTHNTARSEMLYALLVEGLGPQGSIFDRDDFTQREVQDTDGDGLMEFVDAWGQPLQFYRWPLYYISDIQPHGYNPYGANLLQSLSAPREQFPLDPNQTLMSPAWWGNLSGSPNTPSANATLFMGFFYSLVDPQTNGTTGMWDRGSYYLRRAYTTKFLIVSGGPDLNVGNAMLGVNYGALVSGGSAAMPINATNLLLIENQGGVCDPSRTGTYFQTPVQAGPNQPSPTTLFLQDAAGDDITNQAVLAGGGGLQ